MVVLETEPTAVLPGSVDRLDDQAVVIVANLEAPLSLFLLRFESVDFLNRSSFDGTRRNDCVPSIWLEAPWLLPVPECSDLVVVTVVVEAIKSGSCWLWTSIRDLTSVSW